MWKKLESSETAVELHLPTPSIIPDEVTEINNDDNRYVITVTLGLGYKSPLHVLIVQNPREDVPRVTTVEKVSIELPDVVYKLSDLENMVEYTNLWAYAINRYNLTGAVILINVSEPYVNLLEGETGLYYDHNDQLLPEVIAELHDFAENFENKYVITKRGGKDYLELGGQLLGVNIKVNRVF